MSEPRFALESVARRIRRRARFALIAGLSLTAVVIAAVASLFSLGAGAPAGSAQAPPPAVWLPIRISVLGQTALISRSSTRPVFVIPAGRLVHITAQVTVPLGVRVRTLRLGIVTADRSVSGRADRLGGGLAAYHQAAERGPADLPAALDRPRRAPARQYRILDRLLDRRAIDTPADSCQPGYQAGIVSRGRRQVSGARHLRTSDAEPAIVDAIGASVMERGASATAP